VGVSRQDNPDGPAGSTGTACRLRAAWFDAPMAAGIHRLQNQEADAMKLFTHLNFDGNCEEAFRFYAQHLGGTITAMLTQKDLPRQVPSPFDQENAVIHARLEVAGVTLIGNDVPAEVFKPIRSAYVYLAVDSAEAAERIYAALAAGGNVGTPLAETFFASRFAQLRDRFGTLWTLIHERPAPTCSPDAAGAPAHAHA
jgi:PhnB protein